MEIASSVVTVAKGSTWGPKKYPPSSFVFGPYNAPPATDPIEEVRYEPVETYQWVRPSPKPSPSWAVVKQKGEIRMTPYEARRETVHNFIAGREKCSVNFYRPNSYSATPKVCHGIESVVLPHIWRQQGDFPFWLGKVALTILDDYTTVSTRESVASTRTAAIAAFKGGYDLLTELAEVRQGYRFFKDSSAGVYQLFARYFQDHGVVEEKLKRNPKLRPIDLLRSADRKARDAGSAWLAYRYALMPMYYTYKDVAQLCERSGNLYQSFRSSETIDLEASSLPAGSGLFQINTGTIEVNSVIKAGYSNDFLRDYVSNGVQFNPFATAWELVPFSFVIDWFVNVGDFIVANTSANFSPKYAGCTSVKTHVAVDTILKHVHAELFTKSFSMNNACQTGTVTLQYPFTTATEETCQSRVVEHIVRTPFDVTASQLSLNPSMNWRRWVDAAALSHPLLKTLYKRIKK